MTLRSKYRTTKDRYNRVVNYEYSDTELFLFGAAAGVGTDWTWHYVSMKYFGRPGRQLATKIVGAAFGFYYSGLIASYFVDKDEGTDNYRYFMDEVLSGNPVRMLGIGAELGGSVFDATHPDRHQDTNIPKVFVKELLRYRTRGRYDRILDKL